jgi:hypothetical protein
VRLTVAAIYELTVQTTWEPQRLTSPWASDTSKFTVLPDDTFTLELHILLPVFRATRMKCLQLILPLAWILMGGVHFVLAPATANERDYISTITRGPFKHSLDHCFN